MGSGTASAVPDDLFTYSSITSQAGNDLLAWIRTTLAPVVAQYQATAIDAGNQIPNLTLPISVRQAETVDLMATRQVTAAVKTDQTVHDVGQAFQDAGNSGNSVVPPWVHNHLEPGQSPYQYATITIDDTTVDLELAKEQDDLKAQASIQGGLDLAARMNKAFTDAELQELAAHENDPLFCLAFFNNLDPATLTNLLKAWMVYSHTRGHNPGDDIFTALMTALHTGDLSTSACGAIVDAMATNGMGGWDTKFLDALGKDPTAETDFFSQLDDAHLLTLLNGGFGVGNGWGGWADPSGNEARIIQMLTTVYQGMTPPIQELFYERIAGLIRQTSPADALKVLDAVQKLFGVHIALTEPPPGPGATPEQISDWARRVGSDVSSQAGVWVNWMVQFEGQNQDTRGNWETGADFAISMLTTGIGLIASPLVGTIASVAGTVVETWVTPLVAQALDPLTGDPVKDKDALLHNAYVAVRALTVLDLFNNGEIVGPDDKPIPLTQKTLADVVAHPGDYWIKNAVGTKKVQDVLDNAKAQFAP